MRVATARFRFATLVVAGAIAFCGPSSAGEMSAEGAGSTQEFEKANQRMHDGAAMSFTGNADMDFVTGMIPHHQGAIDMAKVQLKYGKDPEIRKLAEDIVQAQENEIALMNAWLAKNKGEANATKAR